MATKLKHLVFCNIYSAIIGAAWALYYLAPSKSTFDMSVMLTLLALVLTLVSISVLVTIKSNESETVPVEFSGRVETNGDKKSLRVQQAIHCKEGVFLTKIGEASSFEDYLSKVRKVEKVFKKYGWNVHCQFYGVKK